MSVNEFKKVADYNRTPGAVRERDGVHFGFFSGNGGVPSLLLYQKGSKEVAAEIPFPESEAGDGFYSMKLRFNPAGYEYNFLDGEQVVTDPYAKLICGRACFGAAPDTSEHSVRAAVPNQKFRWEEDRPLQIPYHEAVMYHLHVRGFTMQKNSGARKKGTFAGLKEKIPYLKNLGINQIKLMPAYEFADMVSMNPGPGLSISAAKGSQAHIEAEKQKKETYKLNYWGYGEGFYFAPKASYAAGRDPVAEFKDMVKAFHQNGIEVLMEFSFPDQADFPLISSCLSYWAENYHVDGFDVKARDSVAAELVRLPLFRTRKLICTWYPDYIKEYNRAEGRGQLAESNDGFMNDCRQMLRGDENFLQAFCYRIKNNDLSCAQINYMTNHDGFTLEDLVSYEEKNNLDNGEQNRDGTDYNFSWNCGEEGPTKKRGILSLRLRQKKNAYMLMLLSQGTPMLLAGDEFGNSQNGNNNPYCHDSELTWTDWSKLRGNRELTEFVRSAIAFRKSHMVLHQDRILNCSDILSSGYPDLSFHSTRAWYGDFEHGHRHIGCLYSGYYVNENNFLYVAYNFNWTEQKFALPLLPKKMAWYCVADTSLKESFIPEEKQEKMPDEKVFSVPGRTVVILEGR